MLKGTFRLRRSVVEVEVVGKERVPELATQNVKCDREARPLTYRAEAGRLNYVSIPMVAIVSYA